nr:contactin-associated protein-like 4 [Salvelinus alpinus]
MIPSALETLGGIAFMRFNLFLQQGYITVGRMELRKLSRLYFFIVCVLNTSSSASAANHHICNGPLVSMLPQGSFVSSSQSSVSYAPHFSKINRRDGAGGWSPQVTDRQPWLQLDLRDRIEVTAISTQGRYGGSDWVSGYLLLFSDTGRAWKQYRQEDGVGGAGGWSPQVTDRQPWLQLDLRDRVEVTAISTQGR